MVSIKFKDVKDQSWYEPSDGELDLEFKENRFKGTSDEVKYEVRDDYRKTGEIKGMQSWLI